ncbi:MAG: hypothetical protein E7056_01900 [Lentisphaerae bacterium]|nr:hypothetical protein [Lentisphaerota bacterium]
MKYLLADAKNGKVYDEFATLLWAKRWLAEYEEVDREDGVYEPNSYAIIRVPEDFENSNAVAVQKVIAEQCKRIDNAGKGAQQDAV